MARVAIVTGGAGALGQAITLRLLADGTKVAVPWIVASERDRLGARLTPEQKRDVFTDECDVTDPTSMATFVRSVVGRFNFVDGLVTAAGGFAGGRLTETDLAEWNRMMTMNVTSAFIAARAVVPWIRNAGGGRIVTIASRAVVPPTGGFLAYTVSKAAVITLTQALADELKVDRITVNTILPSTMDTPANRAAMPDADPKQWTPVEAVADAIAFLMRPETAHVTGALLTI